MRSTQLVDTVLTGHRPELRRAHARMRSTQLVDTVLLVRPMRGSSECAKQRLPQRGHTTAAASLILERRHRHAVRHRQRLAGSSHRHRPDAHAGANADAKVRRLPPQRHHRVTIIARGAHVPRAKEAERPWRRRLLAETKSALVRRHHRVQLGESESQPHGVALVLLRVARARNVLLVEDEAEALIGAAQHELADIVAAAAIHTTTRAVCSRRRASEPVRPYVVRLPILPVHANVLAGGRRADGRANGRRALEPRLGLADSGASVAV